MAETLWSDGIVDAYDPASISDHQDWYNVPAQPDGMNSNSARETAIVFISIQEGNEGLYN